MRKYLGVAVMAMATSLLFSCSQDELGGTSVRPDDIVATMKTVPATRTAVGEAVDGANTVGIVWTDGDELGVFDANGAAQKLYAKVGTGKSATAAFSASGTSAFSSPAYAYYPYSAANDGASVKSLSGTLPAEQTMDGGTLQGDYKYGSVTTGSASTGHEFVFSHLFSLARFVIDANGTTGLPSDQLKSLTVTLTRNGASVPLAGSFTFNAINGEWQQTDAGTNSITLTWTDGPTLSEALTCYMSLFPNVQAGDLFTFDVETTNYKATLSATSLANFEKEQIYTFPLTLNKYSTLKVYDANGTLVQDGPNGGETVTGTFTCATLNVDGLPSIINSDGPGSSGTTTIGNTVNSLGWDFLAVSEDFENHSQLAAAMTNYDAGSYLGTVGIANISKQADTDGLGFFWKKDGFSATNETFVEYNDKEGNLYNGANTCIKKGFRHYEVTVADGVTVDVYITHMNTYSGSGNTEDNAYVKAVLSQLRQLRDYVLEQAKKNNRPAIIMGDTNMRYTRHDIKTNFLDPMTEAGYTVVDPWVTFHRGGVFPTWNTKSLMTRAHFDGDNTNDILCSDDQRGEVVDKVWYINVPNAPVQLKATSCYNDVEHFTKSTSSVSYSGVTTEDANGNLQTGQSVSYTKNIGLADHFPVVVTFEYSYTK